MIPYRLNPLGISVNENIPLTLTAQQANSTVTLNATGSPTVSGLHYRRGKSGTWLAYTIGTTITLANIGDSVQFWNSAQTLTSGTSDYVRFATSGQIGCTGNIQSLLNYSDTCPQYCFWRLFLQNAAITSSPEMPAITLSEACYSGTFNSCSGLRSAPAVLPARTVPVSGYYGMFVSCPISALPRIEAELINTSGCGAMFFNCSQLSGNAIIKASEILAAGCSGMFENCVNLTSAKIIASVMRSIALSSALKGCSRIADIEVSFSSWDGNFSGDWVSGVAASGTFIKPTALPEEYGVNRIPTGWTVVNK